MASNIYLHQNAIPDYSCSICDAAGKGEETEAAASETSSNKLASSETL
jgi:hypothetical protein